MIVLITIYTYIYIYSHLSLWCSKVFFVVIPILTEIVRDFRIQQDFNMITGLRVRKVPQVFDSKLLI